MGIVYDIRRVRVAYGVEGGVRFVNDVICREKVGSWVKGEVREGVVYSLAGVVGVVYGIEGCLEVCL